MKTQSHALHAALPLPAALVIAFATFAPFAHVQAETYQVTMIDEPPYFEPAALEIEVGDTVEWTNLGPEGVHIVSDRNQTIYSGDILLQTSWEHEFKYAGEYEVICGRHFFMHSEITVLNADGSTNRIYDHAYQTAFREFVIPTRDGIPRMIINDKFSDAMWFTVGGGDFYGFEGIPPQNKIVEVDATGSFIEFSTPTPHGDGSEVGVDSLVMDDLGQIWFTERIANRIGKLTPDGQIIEYPIETEDGYALGVDIAPDGRIWFAERYGNSIGWIDSAGLITEIAMPEPDSEPRTVFVDSRGLVWYTAREANEIGYYDPATKSFHRLQIPTQLARPAGIAETSDGTIYFVEMVGNKIAKVVGDAIVEYTIPSAFTAPFKIVADADDKLWFTEVFGNAIGYFDPDTGEFDEFILPTEDSRPGGIAIGDDGNIWFVEQRGNKVGYLDLSELERVTGRKFRAAVAPNEVSSLEDSALPPWAIQDFALPTLGAHPANALAEDPSGRIWFPEMFGNKIAMMDPQVGSFHEIELPIPLSMPTAVALDGDNLWITQFRANTLARLDLRTSEVTDFPLPTPGALPSDLTIDGRGKIWLTQLAHNRIASFEPETELFEEFSLPRPDSGPLEITYDGRDSLWVSTTKEGDGYIARFDIVQRKFTEINTPSPDATPVGLLADEATVWASLGNVGKIGRYDIEAKEWREYQIPSSKSAPFQLARDSEGRIWFTDGGGFGTDGANQIGMLEPDEGKFVEFPITQPRAKPSAILVAESGDVWFTQKGANALSRLTPWSADRR